MIRDARHDDIPAMLALGEAMHHESPRFSRFPWNSAKVAQLLPVLIDSDDGFAVIAEKDGVPIGGMLASAFDHWCVDARMSTDFALFIAPAHRGSAMLGLRLLRRYVRWAQGRGVPDPFIQCGISTGVDLAASTELYRLAGFDHVGHLFEYGG